MLDWCIKYIVYNCWYLQLFPGVANILTEEAGVDDIAVIQVWDKVHQSTNGIKSKVYFYRLSVFVGNKE